MIQYMLVQGRPYPFVLTQNGLVPVLLPSMLRQIPRIGQVAPPLPATNASTAPLGQSPRLRPNAQTFGARLQTLVNGLWTDADALENLAGLLDGVRRASQSIAPDEGRIIAITTTLVRRRAQQLLNAGGGPDVPSGSQGSPGEV